MTTHAEKELEVLSAITFLGSALPDGCGNVFDEPYLKAVHRLIARGIVSPSRPFGLLVSIEEATKTNVKISHGNNDRPTRRQNRRIPYSL